MLMKLTPSLFLYFCQPAYYVHFPKQLETSHLLPFGLQSRGLPQIMPKTLTLVFLSDMLPLPSLLSHKKLTIWKNGEKKRGFRLSKRERNNSFEGILKLDIYCLTI